MNRWIRSAAIAPALAASLAGAAAAQDGTLIPTPYRMDETSSMQHGCFDGCTCPVSSLAPVEGGFWLTPIDYDGLYVHYEVANVDWKVPTGPGAWLRVTGFGRYRQGGEFGRFQRMELDLSLDGGPLRRFDSGLVPATAPWPGIDVTIWLHGEACLDTLFDVKAHSTQAVAADPRAPAFAIAPARPNPFRAGTEIGFTLPARGRVSVRILDLAGRTVRTLADGEFPAGASRVAWNGRDDRGRDPGPGVYFATLRTAAGTGRQVVVRLQ